MLGIMLPPARVEEDPAIAHREPAMQRQMFASFLWTRLIVAAVALITGSAAYGQSMALRQDFADALNETVAAQAWNLLRYPPYEIVVRRLDGSCDTLEVNFPTKTKKKGDKSALNDRLYGLDFDYNLTDSTFTVCVTTSPYHTVRVAADSHPLVRDLNYWLDAAWGVELQSLSGLGSIPFFSGCSNSVSTQPFYRGTLSATDRASVEDAFMDATHGDDISNTYYDINGTLVQGSSFLDFLHDDSGNNVFTGFIADRVNSIARPQKLGLKVTTLGGGGDHFLIVESFLKSYTGGSVTDCGTGRSSAHLVCSYLDNGSCNLDLHFDSIDVHTAIVDPTRSNQGLFDYYANNGSFTDIYGKFGNDEDGQLIFVAFHNSDTACPMPDTSYIMQVINNVVFADRCCMTFKMGGQFVLDELTGQLIYRMNPPGTCGSCCDQPVPCLRFCTDSAGYMTLVGVLDDYAQTFTDSLPLVDVISYPGADPYELGTRGVWRNAKYSRYKTTIISGNDPGTGTPFPRNYKSAGVFDDFRLYNWQNDPANAGTKWLKRDTVTAYSPGGEAVEQRDALGVYSSAAFGYKNTMPILVAKNAQYGATLFESFEDGKGNASDVAHSGRSSRFMSSSWVASNLKIVQQDVDKGLQVRFWAKDAPPGAPDVTASVSINPYVGIVPADAPLKIAQSGEWALYEQVFPINGAMLNSTVSLTFSKIGLADLWLDDIRVQPFEAQMNCYVYDPNTLRVVTIFDDQHFGLFYQYNGEGKLVRKIRETERGMKTIAETEYHTPQISRTTSFGNRIKPRDGDANRAAYSSSSSAEMTSADSSGRVGAGGKFDLLNVEAGPDGTKVEVLGSDDPKLPDVDDLKAAIPAGAADKLDPSRLKLPDLESLPLDDLPVPEQAKVLEELKKLDEQTRALIEERSKVDVTEERKAAIEKGLGELKEKKNEILRKKLGMTDEEIEQWYEANKTEGK